MFLYLGFTQRTPWPLTAEIEIICLSSMTNAVPVPNEARIGWLEVVRPHWDQRVAKDSTLALAVEALPRAVDLRDA
jgi:hypothetical protein